MGVFLGFDGPRSQMGKGIHEEHSVSGASKEVEEIWRMDKIVELISYNRSIQQIRKGTKRSI